VYKILVVK